MSLISFVQTKRKLLNDCDLWCVLSLPGGAFVNAGAGVKTNVFFFTKGRPTERIWYYDLSHIKVGKRSPLTLDHFKEFFDLLPSRSDSQQSWTIDLSARRRQAQSEAKPLRAEAADAESEAKKIKEQILALNANGAQDIKDQIENLTAKAKDLEKRTRELLNKAQSIEDAVYDLKAVNPNAKMETDTRTPEDLLDFIESKGLEIAEALATLRASH